MCSCSTKGRASFVIFLNRERGIEGGGRGGGRGGGGRSRAPSTVPSLSLEQATRENCLLVLA